MLRKRNRPSIVCTFCKKRKVRCDKGNPCSTCVKYGNKECVYGEVGPRPEVPDAASELEYLKHKVQMLESSISLTNLSHSSSNNNSTSTNVTPDSIANNNQPNGYSPMKGSPDKAQKREPSTQLLYNGTSNGYSPGAPYSAQPSVPPTNHLFGNSFPGPFSSSYPETANLRQAQLKNIMFSARDFLPRSFTVDTVLGKNPVSSFSDTINFYEGYNLIYARGNARKAFGPLTWLAQVQTNAPLLQMWLFMKLIKVHQRKMKLLSLEDNVQYDKKEREFRERIEEAEGIQDEKPYKNYPNTNISATISNTTKKTPVIIPTGILLYNAQMSHVETIIEAVREILPPKDIFWGLISRYFSHIYPFLPLIDEIIFRDSCTRIFCSKDEKSEVFDEIKVERRLDFAHVGLTLLVLRFSHLSLTSNVAKVKNLPKHALPEMQRLAAFTIGTEFVDVAHHCLNQFNTCRAATMPVLQLTLFVRLYQIYGPEIGDQGNDLGNRNLLTTAIMQMAQSMGLNREPDSSNGAKDERDNSLCRKVWYYLLVLDLNNALFLGAPMTVSKDMFDTKAPYYIPGVRNVENDSIEEMTVSTFAGFDYVYEQMHDLVTMIVSIKGNMRLHDFTAKLSALEESATIDYQKLLQILDDNSSASDVFSRVMKLKLYFSCSYFLSTIHLRLSSYYESKGEIRLSFYYMNKACLLSVHDMLSLHHCITASNTAIFEKSTDLIITPGFISLVHLGVTIVLSLRIRTLASIIRINGMDCTDCEKDESGDVFRLHQKLTILKGLLEECFKRFSSLIAHLSTRYIYAWKMQKIFRFMDDIMKDEEFHDRLKNASAGSLPATYDYDMVTSLVTLFESTLSNLNDGRKEQKDHMAKFNNMARDSPTGSLSSDSIPDTDQIDQMWLNLMSQKNAWLQDMEQKRDNNNEPQPRLFQPEEINSFNEYNDLANYESMGFDGMVYAQSGKTDKDKIVNFNIFDSLPMDEIYGSFN